MSPVKRFASLLLLTAYCVLSAGYYSEHPYTAYAPSRDWDARPYGLRAFDGRTKSPRWTLERLTAQDLAVELKRDHHAFHADDTLPKAWRVVPGDYDNSGQDRGHLACAANHRNDPEAFDATFEMSNMMPQYPQLNERIWARLEDAIRKMASDGTTVWVITGPAYLGHGAGRVTFKTISEKAIWQPTHCVKAILLETVGFKRECKAWIVPNVADPNQSFDSYRVTTDEAEVALGLDLWPLLDAVEAKLLESRK